MLIAAIIVSATFQDQGISWDEELHVAYGQKLLDYYASGFRDRSAFEFVNLYLYGGFFDLTATVAQLFSPFGVYETRHLIGGLLMLVGLVGVWKLTQFLAGPRAAFIAVAAAVTTPLLFGHSVINPKDAPLAWLAVWIAYFVCRLIGDPASVRRHHIVGLGISLGLALGTRIIAFAFIGQIATILAILLFARHRTPGGLDRSAAWGVLKPFIVAAPIAAAVMAIMWPWSIQSPANVLRAFAELANLGWHPPMLWMGETVAGPNLPRSYLAVLLAVQLPEVVLAGIAFAAVQAVRSGRASIGEARVLGMIYVAATVFVPIAAFALAQPPTYNGLRHFLFVVPQAVVLAAIGLDYALTAAARRNRLFGAAAGGVLALFIARQVILMASIHPYQYLAYNALAGGLSGAYGQFELDYWGVSYLEATRGLLDTLSRENSSATPFRMYVCGSHTSADYGAPNTLTITDDLSEADFLIGGDLSNARCAGLAPSGRRIFEVRRQDVVLSYVLDLRAARATGAAEP